ncbi:MAG: hypothetical protein KDC35_07220 [Acidobacteria bacterium]|nr:hypothetical protein [Acidobacteriota bacterium]
MKSISIILVTIWAGSVSAQTMFGVAHQGSDGMADLYTIDTVTGVATLVGPLGFERCGSIDMGPDGMIYGHAERADGSNIGVLITIDPYTGAGTEIGPTGLNSVADLSFRADGTLFLYDGANDPEHTLFTVNTMTGATTLVGDTGLSFAPGNGMTFFGSTLYLAQDTSLYTLNQATGMATLATALTIGPPPTSFYRFGGLEDAGGTLYGILNDGGTGSGPNYLTTIDPITGAVTIIGQTANGMDGITFGTIVLPVPSMSPSIMIVFVALLAGVAIFLVRRSN